MDLPSQSSWGYFLSTVEEGIHVGVVVGGSVGGLPVLILAVVLDVQRGLELVELITRHLPALFAPCTR